jgi:hypothetical protein
MNLTRRREWIEVSEKASAIEEGSGRQKILFFAPFVFFATSRQSSVQAAKGCTVGGSDFDVWISNFLQRRPYGQLQ